MSKRRELANAIRMLSIDAVEHAQSGHPGMPMGMADIAEVLWNDFLQHDPADPHWYNRDRFILSNGHGSMLHYALLHLTGYDLGLDDIKQFRQLHSKTPGHPEFADTPGVETTTGPLGQGLANAVGMAVTERHLAAHFNRPDFNIIDHYTYVFVGDGCLMEGISHEAASLAGTWGLGKLIVFYDDNGISIDGDTQAWFRDDTAKRFEGYHWHVIPEVDGHNPEAIQAAIEAAQTQIDKPTLICCRTVIGFGSPKLAGAAKSHGAPLGADEVAATRRHLNWPHASFVVPDAIYKAWDARPAGAKRSQAYQQLWQAYQEHYPALAKELERRRQAQLPEDWKQHCQQLLAQMQTQAQSMASRKASLQCIEHLAPVLPEFMGGSADLSGSNCTLWSDARALTAVTMAGNYIHYGVREFAMSAVMNGMALYGAVIPMGGTFLVFCDYARNAVRMAALMQQRVVFVYSHDSIGLGEDGPTHQPIEHISLLRATPNLNVWRPCDGLETAVAWIAAIEHRTGPSCLLLSRQSLPHQERTASAVEDIKRGAYVLLDSAGDANLILLATGSEVALAVSAAQQLHAEGQAVRVVAMPCMEVFAAQDEAYRNQVLPPHIKRRIAIEAGASMSWYQYVGLDGEVIAIDRFGASAPYKDVYKEVGLTVEAIIEAAQAGGKS